jgi:hypothetical protein
MRRLIPDKFDPKFDKCFFIGYPKKIKCYYFYDRSGNKVFIAWHGVFLEEEFLSKERSGSKVTLEEIQDPLPDALGQTEVEQISSEAME